MINEVDTEFNEQIKERVIYSLKLAKYIIEKRHVNLLLTEKNGQHHYTTIKNPSRFVSSYLEGDGSTFSAPSACMESTMKNYSRNIVNNLARLAELRE